MLVCYLRKASQQYRLLLNPEPSSITNLIHILFKF
jgi:hypothetical protein